MSKVQSWTLSLLAVVALAVGVLMASGTVSFAQEGTATPTPAASSGKDDGEDGTTPTPSAAADDGTDAGADSGTDDGTDDGTDGHNCPHDQDSNTDDTSGTDTSL